MMIEAKNPQTENDDSNASGLKMPKQPSRLGLYIMKLELANKIYESPNFSTRAFILFMKTIALIRVVGGSVGRRGWFKNGGWTLPYARLSDL